MILIFQKYSFLRSQDPTAAASKRANTGDANAGGRPKASKKDLSQNDVEQAIRNGQVNSIRNETYKRFVFSISYKYYFFWYWKHRLVR